MCFNDRIFRIPKPKGCDPRDNGYIHAQTNVGIDSGANITLRLLNGILL